MQRMDLPPVTTIKATLQIEARAQEAEECSCPSIPRRLQHQCPQVGRGVSGPNCSQFRQQRRKTSLIAQALTARWSASLVFVWMANPI